MSRYGTGTGMFLNKIFQFFLFGHYYLDPDLDSVNSNMDANHCCKGDNYSVPAHYISYRT
jgi:hypothetical protein